MSQKTQLIDTLKGIIKKEGKNYRDVAKHLGVSEPTVKRIFNTRETTLERLENICHFLKIDIAELVFQMQQTNTNNLSKLTHEQETLIASDIELLLITVLVLNHWSMEEIIQHYQFSEAHCIHHLIKLHKLQLIELQPENKIKLLISPHFKWRDDGPIYQLFRAKIEKEYFQSSFDKPGEHLTALNVMLSDSTSQHFRKKLEKLAYEFNEASKKDSGLAIGDRKGSTVILAMRDWDYKELYGLYRVPKV